MSAKVRGANAAHPFGRRVLFGRCEGDVGEVGALRRGTRKREYDAKMGAGGRDGEVFGCLASDEFGPANATSRGARKLGRTAGVRRVRTHEARVRRS